MNRSAHAHLLVQVEPEHREEAARYLSALPVVTEAARTTGAYDVIAVVSVVDGLDLSRVVAQARRAPGVLALRTCRPG